MAINHLLEGVKAKIKSLKIYYFSTIYHYFSARFSLLLL